MVKVKVEVPAIKEKGTKKVVAAPSQAYSHDELEKKEHRKKNEDKRGFLLSDGTFANRKEAAKIAEKNKQVPKSVGKKLHSHDLREANHTKKTRAK